MAGTIAKLEKRLAQVEKEIADLRKLVKEPSYLNSLKL